MIVERFKINSLIKNYNSNKKMSFVVRHKTLFFKGKVKQKLDHIIKRHGLFKNQLFQELNQNTNYSRTM